MKRFQATPLWTEDASDKYRDRYRLTYFGILLASVMVQVDEDIDGNAMLKAVVQKQGRTIERRQFQLRKSEYAELKALADNSGLWTIYPEFWQSKDEESMCIDGMEAVLEWRGPQGYRFSQGNTSCTSPAGMNKLSEKMVELAKLKTGIRWFPWSK